MKTQLTSLHLAFSMILVLTLWSSCEKVQEIVEENVDLVPTYKSLGKILLETSYADSNFLRTMLHECLLQREGDYHLQLDKLLDTNNVMQFWDNNMVDRVKNIQSRVEEVTGKKIIVFIPSVEKHPLRIDSTIATTFSELLVVVGDEYDSLNKTCPAYRLGTQGSLEFVSNVTENEAWERNMIVVNIEEKVDSFYLQHNPADTATIDYGRVDGGAEYGGRMMVIDMSACEPWVSGKPEFRWVVTTSGSTPDVIIDARVPRYKRKAYKDWVGDWVYIGNWTKSLWGDWVYEKWIEVDGGKNITVKITVTTKSGAKIDVAVTIGNQDDDLGTKMIQFSEPLPVTYSLGAIKFQHSN